MVGTLLAALIAAKAAGEVEVTLAASEGWRHEAAVEELAPGVSVLTIALTNGVAAVPPVTDVRISVPGAGATQLWTSDPMGCCRLWPVGWGTTRYSSQLASETPIAVAFGPDDRAVFSAAADETFEKVDYALTIDEKSCRLTGHFRFFTESPTPRRGHRLRLRLDARRLGTDAAVREAADWIFAANGFVAAEVPDVAREPLYSTWYAHWQDVRADELEREAKIAADLGMKAMILDDGWQKVRSKTFYSATGDWMPVAERFPDMAGHVARVKAMGLKYMLWLSVPFVGCESAAWTRFEGKYLNLRDGGTVGVLDPRYPEVRDYLASTYERVVRDWGFDGVKLDFIDKFVLPKADPAARTSWIGCDTRSVPEAVDRLMKDVLARLRKINPEVLVEFRQRYMGAAIRQYGNMIRATDCPADPTANRKRIADLRLTSGTTAVHSDMLVWSDAETAEGAAYPILSALFGVIQYSMPLERTGELHREVIRHWIRFARTHRAALLEGAFRAHEPEKFYTVLEGESDAERVIAVYAPDRLADLGALDRRIVLVNATKKPSLAVDLREAAAFRFFDTLGRETGGTKAGPGLVRLPVPVSGYAICNRTTER